MKQQQVDVVARMGDRTAQVLAGRPADFDWRERRDDEGDRIVEAERRDRELERGDSPLTHWRV